MPEAAFILLFVDSPERSAAFYAGLLGREPVEQAPPSPCSSFARA